MFEGIIYEDVVPLGTCDNIRHCARKANQLCRDSGQGKAKKAYIDLAEKACYYECDGGMGGVVVCEDKD